MGVIVGYVLFSYKLFVSDFENSFCTLKKKSKKQVTIKQGINTQYFLLVTKYRESKHSVSRPEHTAAQ